MIRKLMGLALLGAAMHASAAVGGPDNDGYRWRDSTEPGVVYSWEDTSGATDITIQDDDFNTGFLNLSFPFPYRGVTYSRVAACSNGWISLVDAGSHAYENGALPSVLEPRGTIAPFWDDFKLTNAGSMFFADLGDRAVVTWQDVPYFADETLRATFQVVLHADGRIVSQIAATTGPLDSATIGIESVDDSDGLTAWFDAPIPAPPYAVEFDPPVPIVPVLDCAGARPLACGDDVVADLATGLASQSEYRCSPGLLDGREHVYRVDLPSPVTVRYRFDVLSGAPRLLLLPGCDPNACTPIDTGLLALTQATGTFYLVVDCAAGDEGSYRLRAECLPLPTALDCNSALPLSCGASVSGDLAAGTALQDAYWCSLADYGGREQVYRVDFPTRVASATFTLTATSGNPDLIGLYPCDADACLGPPGDSLTLADVLGPVYLVVDCAPGAEGAYRLDITGGAPPARTVGDALRVVGHGPGTADLDWSGADAPLPGDAYAVLRSDGSPSGPFTLRAETGWTAWTDPSAPERFVPPHAWYWLVLLTDPCGNLSRD